jgi:hypothetical protein
MIVLKQKGHQEHARSVSSRSLPRFGNTYFTNVGSFTLLVQMQNGRHSVNYVIWVIAELQCMLVFHYFLDFIIL